MSTARKMSETCGIVLITTDHSFFKYAKSVLCLHDSHPCTPGERAYASLRSGSLPALIEYRPEASHELKFLPGDKYVGLGADFVILDFQKPRSPVTHNVHAEELLVVSAEEVDQQQQPSKLLSAINVLRNEVGEDYRWLEDHAKELLPTREKDISQFKARVRYHGFSSRGNAAAHHPRPETSLDPREIICKYPGIDASTSTMPSSVVFLSIPTGEPWETLCLLYTQEIASILENPIGNTVDGMRGSQKLVLPLANLSLPSVEPVLLPRHGNDVLIVIPTENKSKKRCLEGVIPHKTPKGRPVRFTTVAADSNVGEQPYNGAGVVGARNRIQNALTYLATPQNQDCLQKWGIGTVVVACIENFIQIENVDQPTDYGVLVFYNANTNQAVTGISRGVTVPKQYVDRARRFGLEDNPDHGRITVGQILAANVPGLDKADWHSVLAGCSRYDLLQEAAQNLQIPW